MSETWISNRRRHARVRIGNVPNGQEIPWVLTEDVNGSRIPPRISIHDIMVVPSQATIFGFRIFTRASRIHNINDVRYSLIYEDTWGAAPVASADALRDRTDVSYVDDDAIDEGQENLGSIYGSLEIQAAANNSAFLIDIFYSL